MVDRSISLLHFVHFSFLLKQIEKLLLNKLDIFFFLLMLFICIKNSDHKFLLYIKLLPKFHIRLYYYLRNELLYLVRLGEIHSSVWKDALQTFAKLDNRIWCYLPAITFAPIITNTFACNCSRLFTFVSELFSQLVFPGKFMRQLI